MGRVIQAFELGVGRVYLALLGLGFGVEGIWRHRV